jgi:hypothetical protein
MKNPTIPALTVCFLAMVLPCPAQDAATNARAVLDQSGVKGGFVVHVGPGDGPFTAALRGSDGTLVHGLVRDAAAVKAVRESVHESGNYGLVSVDTWNGTHLPYVEGTVNLLVIDEG